MEPLLGLPLDDVTKKLKSEELMNRKELRSGKMRDSRKTLVKGEKIWADKILHGTDVPLDSITKALRQDEFREGRRRGRPFNRRRVMRFSMKQKRFSRPNNMKRFSRLSNMNVGRRRPRDRGYPDRRLSLPQPQVKWVRGRRMRVRAPPTPNNDALQQVTALQAELQRMQWEEENERMKQRERLRQQKLWEEDQMREREHRLRAAAHLREQLRNHRATRERVREEQASRVQAAGERRREAVANAASDADFRERPPVSRMASPRRTRSASRQGYPTVKVVGIPPKYTAADINNAFKGHFDTHHVIKTSPGCAYILFKTIADARRAKKQFDGGEMNDNKIKITIVEDMV